jgi:hypothetical protein
VRPPRDASKKAEKALFPVRGCPKLYNVSTRKPPVLRSSAACSATRAERVARARERGAGVLLLELCDGGLHLQPHRLVGAVKARVHLAAAAVGRCRSIAVPREVRFRLPEDMSGVS